MNALRAATVLAASALLVTASLMSCGVAVAQTADATGHATNALTSAPVQSAFIQRVSSSPYPSAYTDAAGSYTLAASPNTSNTFLAWQSDYLSPGRWKNYVGTGTVTIDWSLYPHAVSQIVYDSFGRANSPTLGSTEDAAHYAWVAGPTRSSARIIDGALELQMNGPGETGDGVSLSNTFVPPDFDMTCVVKSITSSGAANSGIICYRQDTTQGPGNSQYGFGMSLFMRKDGTSISLAYYWFGILNDSGVNGIATYTPGTAIDWSQPHTIRIRANGYHHEVWLDSNPTPIISFFCTQGGHDPFDYGVTPPTRKPGYIGFYRSTDTAMKVDSIQINAIQQGTGVTTGTVTGTVSDAANPSTKISGATVALSNGTKVTTDSQGVYTATVPAGTPFWALASASGYLNSSASTVSGGMLPGETVTRNFSLSTIPAGLTVRDSFSRADSSAIGSTEDSHHYPWIASWQTNGSISGKKFQMQPPVQGDGLTLGGISGGFLPADIDMSAQMTINSGSAAGLAYRQTQPTSEVGNWAWGYALKCASDGTSITLGFYDYGIVQWSQVYTPSLPIDWSIPHTLRVRAVASHHEVWLDGTKIIDATDSHRLTGGLVIIGKDSAGVTLDDFLLTDLAVTPMPLSQVRALADGTRVLLVGVFVTAVYSGFFYAEDPSRACGMKIVGSTSAAVGDGVQVDGTISTANGERYITSTATDLTGDTSFIVPVGLAARSVAGAGLSPVGLLTTTWGKVTSVSADQTYFEIEDGSAIGPNGLKVIISPRAMTDLEDKYVTVDGIVSTTAPNTRVVRASEEPFVDYNSSGYWNPGESYTDTNGNGAFDGIIVLGAPTVAPPPGTIAHAKTVPSGTSVTLTNKVVTAGTDQMKSPSFFYIQENGVGIRVRSSTPARQGDRVTVVGNVRRASDGGTVVQRNGEREINATSVTPTYGPFAMPAPTALTNRQVGGGPTAENDTDGYPCQPGVWASSNGWGCGYDQVSETGPNNVGLFCQVTGTVVYVDDVNKFFYINDGSNVVDGSWVSGAPPPPGIRILVPAGVSLAGIMGKSATVTGVVGSVVQSDAGSPRGMCGNYVRNIRVIRAAPEAFLDLNLNGFWDSGERYLDTNGNGNCDGIRISGVPAPNVVSRFDRFGTLILRGAPFMPRGLYCYDVSSGTLNSAKNQGFNAVQCFDAMSPSDLATFNAVGIKAFPTLHNPATRDAWMGVKTDPAIAAWYLNDEPEWHGETPAANLVSYNWVYSQDGTHPVGNSHADVNYFDDYAASDDMCWFDRYPVGNTGSQYCIPSIATYADTARAAHGNNPYYPVWQYVQMFKEGTNFTMPTVAQFRAMIYTAMARYVKGYFYFSYQQGGPDWQALWAEAANVNSQMNTLRSFLTLPWVPLDVTCSNPTWIKTGGYRIGNSALLIVVNADKDASQFATITLPGVPNNTVLTAPIGGAGQTLSGKSFTYTFAPCEVRVLLWGSIPTPP